MDAKLKIHNRFDFELIKADGTVVTAQAENVVLNQTYDMYNGIGNILSPYYASQFDVHVTLGTGTGTPAVTDTALFDTLYTANATALEYDLLADSITKCMWSVTIPETAAIGALTEVGLMAAFGRYSSPATVLVTHALITDSENNPITINKTSADILNITATVYFKLTPPVGYKVVRGDFYSQSLAFRSTNLAGNTVPADAASSGALPGITWSPGYSRFARFCPLGSISQSAPEGLNFKFFGVSHPITGYVDNWSTGVMMYTTNTNDNANSELMRCTAQAIDSTSGNLSNDEIYLIKGIITPGDFWISFPNHNLYPPKELTLSLTGDGVNTDFDLPVPELMTSNVTVKVGGVVQDPSTYQFSGKNFNMKQAWCSFDTKYVIETGCRYINPSGSTTSATPLVLTWPCAQASITVDAATYQDTQAPRVYDFGSPKTVNTFKTTVYDPTWQQITVKLEYSSDGTTWTTAASLPADSAGTQTFSSISARYWRLVDLPFMYTRLDRDLDPSLPTNIPFGFDNVEPTIRFSQAPAAQSTIEITCYCEYPMKNSNWRVDSLVTDIKYVRDNS